LLFLHGCTKFDRTTKCKNQIFKKKGKKEVKKKNKPNSKKKLLLLLKMEANLLPPQSKEHTGKKTLLLDLDETLVHSSFKVWLQI
jgi:TFIIF-interacting CTD phosphatase-like protein